MELATTRLFRAKWTDQIHDEWTRNVLKNRPDLSRERLARTRALMDAAVMDCLVTGHEPLIPSLTLPDTKDRHVLAAAIRAGASFIITFNLKDFPSADLDRYGITAEHPDWFIVRQAELDPSAAIAAARLCRDRLKNPVRTASQYLDTLESQALPLTAAMLRPFSATL